MEYDALSGNIEEQKFFILFEQLKSSHFKLGHKKFYLNATAENYVNSVFGNYLLNDIRPDHFMKIERSFFFHSINNYLLSNFISSSISSSQKHDFTKNVLTSVEFGTQGAIDFFQFIPDDTLSTIIPDIGGPYDHFTAFIILNEEIIEDKYYTSIAFIEMFRD